MWWNLVTNKLSKNSIGLISQILKNGKFSEKIKLQENCQTVYNVKNPIQTVNQHVDISSTFGVWLIWNGSLTIKNSHSAGVQFIIKQQFTAKNAKKDNVK